MTYKDQEYSWVSEKNGKTLWRCNDDPKKLVVTEGTETILITEISSLKEWK